MSSKKRHRDDIEPEEMHVDHFPDGILLQVFEYLDNQSLFKSVWTRSRWRRLVYSSDNLQRTFLRRKWPWLPADVNVPAGESAFIKTLGYFKRIPHEIDQTLFDPWNSRLRRRHNSTSEEFVRVGNIDGRTSYQYLGNTRSNSELCLRTTIPFPVQQTSFCNNPYPLLIGDICNWELKSFFYFELTVHSSGSSTDTAGTCIAIGLGNENTPLHGNLPGWESKSLGYHGDDGGIYGENSTEAITNVSTFGAGDTVGVGYMHVLCTVYFTKNGRTMYMKDFSGERTSPFGEQMFPLVGLDSSLPVTLNFTGPFVYRLDPGLGISFESF